MSRAVANWLGIALAGATFVCIAAAQPPAPSPQAVASTAVSPQRALLDKYCVICHNQRLRTAGLALDKTNVDDISAAPEIWEKVAHKLRTAQMPPAGLPRPDQATVAAFASWLETNLDQEAEIHPNPGRVPIHRLNRTEYVNSVRDLLALDIDGRSLLPPDGVDQQGFDNIAGVLSVSPALLEAYISSARKVSRLAVGDPHVVPVFETYNVPALLTQNVRMSEDLPFGSRGGTAIRHRFPVDGQYVIKINLRRNLVGYILGLGQAHQLEVRLNGKCIARFKVGGDAPPNGSPATFAGNIMGDPKWDLYMHEADKGLEVRFPAKAGTATVGVDFVKDVVESEEIPQAKAIFDADKDERYNGIPEVDNVLIGGPYDPTGPGETASRKKIFICHPARPTDEPSCAKQILSALSRHAYRRPVTEQEIQTLLGFYQTGRKQGGFEAGIQLALERILADPNFLFRVERDPANAAPGTVYQLTDLELASRLSFFLWSSIPDEELLDVAAEGKLKDPAVLEHQVQRMFADSRSNALVENFAAQWLELGKMQGVVPDPSLFPEFDENLRQAFQQETELFLESQMRADHGIVDMLTADYTFVNERLAKHYGIPNIYGDRFRRVQLNGEQRGGLLGQGSVLLATSYPNRTSVVIRGKWILDNILGMPPPPPPANVPSLKETGANGKPTSIRERMEEHRRNPNCAVCHVRMVPLGFALENYDATGGWRVMSDGAAVDASASLPDGTRFQGMAGLRQLLANRREQFVETFIAKLMTYALGREVESSDLPAIRKIRLETAASDYRWSAIVAGIAKSMPFQKSAVESAPSGNPVASENTRNERAAVQAKQGDQRTR